MTEGFSDHAGRFVVKSTLMVDIRGVLLRPHAVSVSVQRSAEGTSSANLHRARGSARRAMTPKEVSDGSGERRPQKSDYSRWWPRW
jgi:hypothetical protein